MKAREFGIDPDEVNCIEETTGERYPCDNCFKYDPTRLDWNIIHVIEFSAFQALEARHKKLLEALRKINPNDTYENYNEQIALEAIEADRLASENRKEN